MEDSEPEIIIEFQEEYRFLSNFTTVIVELDGQYYPSTEHAYQAAKTLNTVERKIMQNLVGAGAAKNYGRKVTLRDDWDEIKDLVMEDLQKQKYSGKNLRRKLLETGDAVIFEGNEWHDTYWGVCYCELHAGEGLNKLGTILMNIREELRSECNE